MSGRREDVDWSVRQLKPSGRWQARYKDPDGQRKSAGTYETSRDASEAAIRAAEDVRRGTWRDPARGEERFSDFAERALAARAPDLKPRTVEGYRSLLENHLLPTFAERQLKSITRSAVDVWYADLRGRLGAVAVRNAYFCLRGFMRQAVEWELIDKNPCQRKGAGKDVSKRRPTMTLEHAIRIFEAHPDQLRPLLWLTLHAHLRLGEVCALRRSDLDLERGTLLVERQVQTVRGGTIVSETKTENVRTVALSHDVLGFLREILAENLKLPSAPLFVSPKTGGPVRREYIQMSWRRARDSAGLPEFHFHDLRHLGLSTAAEAGLTQRELMERAGHSTGAAALRYQHAAAHRQREVADVIGALMPISGPRRLA